MKLGRSLEEKFVGGRFLVDRDLAGGGPFIATHLLRRASLKTSYELTECLNARLAEVPGPHSQE